RYQEGRVLRCGRPVRLRQIDAARIDRRADGTVGRRYRIRRPRDQAGHSRRRRRRLSGRRLLSLAQRARKRRIRLAAEGDGHRGKSAPRRRRHRDDGPARFFPQLSGAAFRRHAPARLHRAHDRDRTAAYSSRRAVRRTRSADAAADGRRDAAALAGNRRDNLSHHARARRSRHARRPHRRDVGAAGKDHRPRRDEMAARARQPHRRKREFRRADQPPVEIAARGIDEDDGAHGWRGMTRLRLYQFAIVAAFVALLEVLCLTGVIDKVTMPPPHIILRDFVRLIWAGEYFDEIGKSLANVLAAFALAFAVGTVTGVILHGYKTARDVLDPLFATYYAIPVFAFYPLFIVMFGLGDGPQLLIGFLLGVVAVIVTMLNGLDRVPAVLKKTARINRLGPLQTALRVTLPFCAPYLLTAAKLALAYAFIGVIGSEFIMARSGMGYEIGFAYTNFDNATMYPLILLILLLSIVLNGVLTRWEKLLLARRGQS